jgi:mycofactocin precursor
MSDAQTAATPSDADPVEEDLLVEDVSIDGMCGVY